MPNILPKYSNVFVVFRIENSILIGLIGIS